MSQSSSDQVSHVQDDSITSYLRFSNVLLLRGEDPEDLEEEGSIDGKSLEEPQRSNHVDV